MAETQNRLRATEVAVTRPSHRYCTIKLYQVYFKKLTLYHKTIKKNGL